MNAVNLSVNGSNAAPILSWASSIAILIRTKLFSVVCASLAANPPNVPVNCLKISLKFPDFNVDASMPKPNLPNDAALPS